MQLSGGEVVALDFLPLMLERTQALAAQMGVAERLTVIEQDMASMDFAPGSFDIIWSEGAIYNIGFEHGLSKLKAFVRPGGYVAVSDAIWLQADPPAEVRAFWAEYPEIDTVEQKIAVIKRLGYELEGHFVLPAEDWLVDYYTPMEALLAEKEKVWAGIPQGLAVIEATRQEIALFRNYSAYYSYGFFVMRRP